MFRHLRRLKAKCRKNVPFYLSLHRQSETTQRFKKLCTLLLIFTQNRQLNRVITYPFTIIHRGRQRNGVNTLPFLCYFSNLRIWAVIESLGRKKREKTLCIVDYQGCDLSCGFGWLRVVEGDVACDTGSTATLAGHN